MDRKTEKEQNKKGQRREKEIGLEGTHTLIPRTSVSGTSGSGHLYLHKSHTPRRHLVQDRICGPGKCLDLCPESTQGRQ